MTYTLKEELAIIVLLITYGIYISLYFDVLNIFLLKIKNKFLKIVIEIIFCALQIYSSYLFIYTIQDGYIPIYFLAFILIGILVYLCYHTKISKIINYLINKLMSLIKTILKEITNFIYPKYLKEIKTTLSKRRKSKKTKDIEILKG